MRSCWRPCSWWEALWRPLRTPSRLRAGSLGYLPLGQRGVRGRSLPSQLIAARVVQALGAAGLIPGSLAILGAAFEGDRRDAAIGTWSSFSAISAVLGQVLGGYLIDTIRGGPPFVNVPLALVVLLIVFRYVPESHSEDTRSLDLPGALLVTVG